MVYSFFELICFLLPLCILICFILLAINGKNNNKSNTITINDRKYLVKGNRLFDYKTNAEVGYLDGNKIVFKNNIK